MSMGCSSRPSPLAVALLTCFAVTQHSAPAWAYRPFDGTDAEVEEPGEVEIELQPAGILQEGSEKTLVAPATVINFGLPDGWEATLQGQGEFPISPSGQPAAMSDAGEATLEGQSPILPSGQPAALTEAGVSLKHVWRPGSLQNVSGPSIATEVELLLPGINADSGFGVSVDGILSQRFDWGTIHFNVEPALTRDHLADLFVSMILEGPSTWTVRPVAEIFYEEEFGKKDFRSLTVSGLIGAIWQVREDLAFDIGFRHGYDLTNRQPVNEIRAGMTFGFPMRLGTTPSALREEYGPRQGS
jgi:hypothetical protein